MCFNLIKGIVAAFANYYVYKIAKKLLTDKLLSRLAKSFGASSKQSVIEINIHKKYKPTKVKTISLSGNQQETKRAYLNLRAFSKVAS